VAVHDRDPGRARELSTGTGARVHDDLPALLTDPRVDAVYVALPHDLLAPTVVLALDAGRDVLVEKPAGISEAGIAEIRAAAARSGRSVGVAFELRFVAPVAVARDLVRAGAIGAVRLVRIRTLIDKPRWYWSSGPTGVVADPWRASRERAGGGVVLMNAIHQLDLVRTITGLDVVRVSGEIDAGIPGVEVEDVAAATLRFDGGALGELVCNAHAPGIDGGETIEIDGTLGTIRLGDPYVAAPRLELFLREPWRHHRAGRWIAIEPARADPWSELLRSFAAALVSGRQPEPGIDDAEAALATVLAIYRAAAGGAVVPVRRSFDAPSESI
jgi:predicted dehydrogenase